MSDLRVEVHDDGDMAVSDDFGNGLHYSARHGVITYEKGERPEPLGELVDALKRENDALRTAAYDKDALIMTLNEDIAAWRTISRNAFHKLVKTNELVRDLLQLRCRQSCADCEHEDDEGCDFMTRAIELGIIELESEEE